MSTSETRVRSFWYPNYLSQLRSRSSNQSERLLDVFCLTGLCANLVTIGRNISLVPLFSFRANESDGSSIRSANRWDTSLQNRRRGGPLSALGLPLTVDRCLAGYRTFLGRRHGRKRALDNLFFTHESTRKEETGSETKHDWCVQRMISAHLSPELSSSRSVMSHLAGRISLSIEPEIGDNWLVIFDPTYDVQP